TPLRSRNNYPAVRLAISIQQWNSRASLILRLQRCTTNARKMPHKIFLPVERLIAIAIALTHLSRSVVIISTLLLHFVFSEILSIMMMANDDDDDDDDAGDQLAQHTIWDDHQSDQSDQSSQSNQSYEFAEFDPDNFIDYPPLPKNWHHSFP
ncbi:hypothetical protein F5B21DRAFT_106275, partial [Xylaria acuta]